MKHFCTDFIALAYEKTCYVSKIEDVYMTDQDVEVVCVENCWMLEGDLGGQ